ncbi:MAG: aminopeptidase [Erysipelothrix sp.]|nr:aminopeptidase [Erysipelothrix sp.]
MVFDLVDDKILEKYAELAVNVGINIKKNQPVVMTASLASAKFARLCAQKAYDKGAKFVHVLWHDDEMSKINFINADISNFENIAQYKIDQYDYFIDEKVARLNIIDDVPGYFADVDSSKLAANAKAAGQAFKRYRDYSMGNHGQWTIVAVPSVGWANLVFPKLSDKEAVIKLWDAILAAVRVGLDNDPAKEWNTHNEKLKQNNDILNQHNFKSLHFTNSVGTDLTVGLADNHRWAGGSEVAGNGQIFNPNLPTEENFTMPHRDRVDGTVVSTKPLDYQGVLIDNFKLEFKDGKVISAIAEKNEDKLIELLDNDEGSRHIGEVALLPHDSPIQNSDILFYNTLFDENASCHLALGNAYPMNIIGGVEMDEEQLKSKGYNSSLVHVDFMFGSADMKIDGIKHDGSTIAVFRNGNFVI